MCSTKRVLAHIVGENAKCIITYTLKSTKVQALTCTCLHMHRPAIDCFVDSSLFFYLSYSYYFLSFRNEKDVHLMTGGFTLLNFSLLCCHYYIFLIDSCKFTSYYALVKSKQNAQWQQSVLRHKKNYSHPTLSISTSLYVATVSTYLLHRFALTESKPDCHPLFKCVCQWIL